MPLSQMAEAYFGDGNLCLQIQNSWYSQLDNKEAWIEFDMPFRCKVVVSKPAGAGALGSVSHGMYV